MAETMTIQTQLGPLEGDRIQAEDGEYGFRLLSSLKRDHCPNCDKADCYYDCDQAKSDGSLETDEDLVARCRSNSALDGIEVSVLALGPILWSLAQLRGGESPILNLSLDAAIDAVGNNIR